MRARPRADPAACGAIATARSLVKSQGAAYGDSEKMDGVNADGVHCHAFFSPSITVGCLAEFCAPLLSDINQTQADSRLVVSLCVWPPRATLVAPA